MERTPFRERVEIKMAALNLGQKELADLVEAPVQRVNEALRGETTPRASSLRVKIDQSLTRLAGEKRKRMAEEIKQAADTILEGELSVLLPEDVMYIVLQDGEPIALWFPETKTIKALPPTLGM